MMGMATVWRKKAYEMFGFKPGAFSFAQGKVELFAELRDMAQRAAHQRDSALLDRIFEYALWAEKQNAEDLKSTVDIVFFIPLLGDETLLREANPRVPTEILQAKRAMVATDAVRPR
jgi:hypothetical protein